MTIMHWIAIVCYSFNIAITAFALSSGDDKGGDKIINVLWSVLWPLFYFVMFVWVIGERLYWWIYNRKNRKHDDG